MISRIFLAFNAITIGAIGILYLYDPNILLGRYDLAVDNAGMDNMLRAAYGGIFLGVSSLFMVGLFNHQRHRDSLLIVAVFMAGAALGRIASLLSVGSPPATIMVLLYFELIMAVIALVLFKRSPKSS